MPLGDSGSNLSALGSALGVDPDMALPQSLQNLALSSFCDPQLVQYILYAPMTMSMDPYHIIHERYA